MNTNEGKITYFVYARKSQENEERQVQSIQDQLADLKKVAIKLNLEIKKVFTEAKSAKAPFMRPVFDEMVKRIQKGEANGILVWHTNRLFRNPVDLGTIQWMLQQGVIQRIQTLDRQFNPTDSVILLSIEGSMANQYIIDLRNACTRGMASKASKGWLPSLPPAGYITDRNTKTIVIDTKRFHLIRKMWGLLLTGAYSPSQICTIANKEWGYRTRRTNRQGGNELSVSMLYHIFHNIFYTGMFEWAGKRYQGNHKPMITPEEFERAQRLLNNNGAQKAQKHEFAFTGLIKCGQCGCGITATRKTKWVEIIEGCRTYDYYHCTRKKRDIICMQPPLRNHEIEEQVIEFLQTIEIPEIFAAIANTILQSEQSRLADDTNTTVSMLSSSLAKTRTELENLNRMRYKEFIDDEFYLLEKTKLNNTVLTMENKLMRVEEIQVKARENATKALKLAINITDTFKNGTSQEKKEIMCSIGSNFRLMGKKLLFDKAEWLSLVEKSYPPIDAAKSRLEPIQNADTVRVKEAVRLMYSDLVHLFEQCSNSEEEEYPINLRDSDHPPSSFPLAA